MTDHLELDRDKCLSDLSYSLSEMLGIPPIAATAVTEHVFQSLVEHFYESGSAYICNFGWLHVIDGEIVFTPCEAMEQTSAKLRAAISSGTSSFAMIENAIEAAERANTISHSEEK